jgi:hypothetical protein
VAVRGAVRIRVVSDGRCRLASVLNGRWSPVPPRTAGRGSASTRGRGRRITTAAGATRAAAGTGIPGARGASAWVSWARRRTTSAGARSATTTVPSSRCR